MPEIDSKLTDVHMVILALLRRGTVGSRESLADILDLPEDTVQRCLDDLEVEGFIKGSTLH